MIKPQNPSSSRLLAFASDSESEDEPERKRVSIDVNSSQKRIARVMQEDALKEDPTIFQYDEVYDDITATREEAKKAKSTEVRESKYISRLLVTAEKRKLEHETRLERKVQKEREAEGDMFKDKEVFVTASYRAKLEALKKAEEEAQREEYLEGIGDVRKQKDLSGFYRHMYEQKLGNEKTDEKKESDEPAPAPTPDSSTKDEKSKIQVPNKKRAYRKHNEDESDEEEPSKTDDKNVEGSSPSKKVHLQSNLDADSDFSIDSDSDSDSENEDGEKGDKKEKVKKEIPESKEVDKVADNQGDGKEADKSIEGKPDEKIPPETNGKDTDVKSEALDTAMMPPPEPKPVKPKIDVWKKRTVGDVYLAAVQRYYERKQSGSA